MPYITCVLPDRHHQMTLEEMLSFQPGIDDLSKYRTVSSPSSTRTVLLKDVPQTLKDKTNLYAILKQLQTFNNAHVDLHEKMDTANARMVEIRAARNAGELNEKEYTDLANRSMSELEGCLAAARSESFNETCLDSLSATVSKIRAMSEKFLGGGTDAETHKESRDSVTFSTADLGIADASVSGKIWYDAGYEPVYTELTEQIKQFMTLTYSSLAPRAAQLNKNAYRSVAPVLLSLLVMIAIVLMFFYFIMVYCVKPVIKMNKSLGGYLSYRLPYEVKTELLDEIKELNDNIESLINISKQNNKQ